MELRTGEVRYSLTFGLYNPVTVSTCDETNGEGRLETDLYDFCPEARIEARFESEVVAARALLGAPLSLPWRPG